MTWTSSLPTAIAPLNEGALASATAFSGSANQAGTFYTQNGVAAPSSKAFRILGYVDFASGPATAGTYASAPTTVQLFGPGIRKPGETRSDGLCVYVHQHEHDGDDVFDCAVSVYIAICSP